MPFVCNWFTDISAGEVNKKWMAVNLCVFKRGATCLAVRNSYKVLVSTYRPIRAGMAHRPRGLAFFCLKNSCVP